MTTTFTIPTLETERLILRAPTRADWPAYAEFMGTPAASFFRGHNRPTEAWKSFGAVIWHWIDFGFGPFALTLRDQDTCIGLVGPKSPPGWPEGEITWMVFGSYAGQGLATEAARATLAFARDALGWTTAVSYIEDANTPSIRLAARLGATRDDRAAVPGGDVRAYRHDLGGA